MLIGGIPFVAGLVGLIGFGIVRMWEERRGTRIFARSRAALDRVTASAYRLLVTGDISHEYRVHLIKSIRTFVHQGVVLLVTFLRAIERPLSRLSHRMRVHEPVPTHREPSEYLKTITPAKPDTDTTSGAV